MPLILIGFAASWVVANAQSVVREYDAWWHLRLGDGFIAGESLSSPAGLTPFATERWVPTQWLSEVATSYLVGLVGLAAVPALVAAASAMLVIGQFAASRTVAGLLPATVATLVSLAVLSAYLVPRPQVMTFVLLSVFVAAWLRSAEDLRPRWWLVPLSYLWASLHGMWFVGPTVGLAVTGALVLERRVSRGAALRLFAVSAVGLLVAAITPVGPALVLGPINVSGISDFIVEWQPPDFRDPDTGLTLLLVLVVALTWSRSPKPARWAHVALFVLAIGCTVYAARTVPLGAILAAPLAASAMSSWLGRGPEERTRRRDLRWVVLIAACALVVAVAAFRPQPAAVSAVGASIDDHLVQVPTDAVVFNEYAFGGWLLWRHPHVTPVIDGLTESYSPDHIAAHMRALGVTVGWRDLLRRTDPDYALLFRRTPLSLQLQEHGWVVQARGQSPRGEPVILLARPETES